MMPKWFKSTLIALGVLLAALILLVPFEYYRRVAEAKEWLPTQSPEDLALFGDYIGGTLGTIVAAIAAIFFYRNLTQINESNRLLKEQLEQHQQSEIVSNLSKQIPAAIAAFREKYKDIRFPVHIDDSRLPKIPFYEALAIHEGNDKYLLKLNHVYNEKQSFLEWELYSHGPEDPNLNRNALYQNRKTDELVMLSECSLELQKIVQMLLAYATFSKVPTQFSAETETFIQTNNILAVLYGGGIDDWYNSLDEADAIDDNITFIWVFTRRLLATSDYTAEKAKIRTASQELYMQQIAVAEEKLLKTYEQIPR